ncbi:hypothetical protein [Ferrovibrio sp.]|uniref:hypothetical protein n=1 Tax=Ferrovibrio sp. TaxID=1917215 RepID=UPI000CC22A13|nr:hypothetical protein [Ferrovibrio sp.]PJI40396.1 MAG: hypothetical protein CTR53_10320 [Ferrovibrio sp.]
MSDNTKIAIPIFTHFVYQDEISEFFKEYGGLGDHPVLEIHVNKKAVAVYPISDKTTAILFKMRFA